MHFDCNGLKRWFAAEKRDLPWRQTQDPYAIWVSEVMLQQTQVAVVIPYFLHWMERFPTVLDLAQAPLDSVLKAWEGLGYYSRARNLHAGAKYVLEHFEGAVPARDEQLKQIKGLGPYTVGAILSFAFHQKIAAVDGNVMRVLARYFGIEEDIAKSGTIRSMRSLAAQLLPDEEPWIVNEALIELGATICQKKARCQVCPLKKTCVSFQKGDADRLPIKSKGPRTEYLFRAVAILQCGSSFLVKRGEKGGIMSDLYEFPYFEVSEEGILPRQFQAKLREAFNLEVRIQQEMEIVRHGFTRYQATLYPVRFACCEPDPIQGFEWLPMEKLKNLAFSSGHRRIFLQL